MTRQRFDPAGEQGFTLFYTAACLTGLLLFVGLAVDSGRAYVVKAQLSKAVDGAALGAARMLNSGDPRGEAERLFRANFETGYLGTSSVTDPSADPNFFSLQTIPATGVNIVTIQASAVLPTTFMRIANFTDVTVTSSAEATRRMVDLSLVLDVSSSIGSRWPAVRDAARTFVDAFDANSDRMALVTYGNGAIVREEMPSSRGFDKAAVMAAIPNNLPGGSTAMVEGLYRGWDELRTVPGGSQSGLRVIVLFTDGASNSVPGAYPPNPGIARGLRTYDFPKNLPDPDNQTHNSPNIVGLFDTETGAQNPAYSITLPWNSIQTLAQVPYLPLATWHAHRRSSGIPSSFPLQTGSLTVNGSSQTAVRGLRNWNAARRPLPGRHLQHQQRRPQRARDHRRRGARGQRRLPDPHLHDRDGRAGPVHARDDARAARGHPDARGQRRAVARLQRRPAGRQVLLRADRCGRRAGLPGAAEPDHPSDQVDTREHSWRSLLL